MNSPNRKLLAGLLALALPLAAARSDVLRYRYSLHVRSGDPSFAAELPAEGSPAGPWHEVERDSRGRVVRVAEMRDAKKESEAIYRYPGDSMYFDSEDDFVLGERNGSVKIQRNDKGYQTRTDSFTVSGSPTGYGLRTYGPDSVEVVYYASDGAVKNRYVNTYSDQDVLVSYRRYVGTAYYEYQVDPATGHARSRKKVEDGKQVLSSTFAYDENGEVLREDAFDANGVPFASIGYTNGLITRKNYKFTDGTHKEIDITFDEKRLAKEARLYINEKLICTFAYDRLPDGTVKRTMALGPGGELWAEYPDRFVNEVTQDGQALNRTDGIIHHAGNWW